MRVLCLAFVSMVLVNSEPSEECRSLMSACREGDSEEACRQLLKDKCGPNQGGSTTGGSTGGSTTGGSTETGNSNGEENNNESDAEANHDMDPAGVWKVADMETCVQQTCNFSIHPSADERGGRRLSGEARAGWDEEIFAADFNHSFVGRPSAEQLKCICEKCSPLIEKQLHTLHCSPPGKDEDGNFRTTHKPCDLDDKEAIAGAWDLTEKLLHPICPGYARYGSYSVYDEIEIEFQEVTGWTQTSCTHLPTGVHTDECDAIWAAVNATPAPTMPDCEGNPFAGLSWEEIQSDKKLKKLLKKAEKNHKKFSLKLQKEGLSAKKMKKYQKKLEKIYDVLRQASQAGLCVDHKK